LVDPTVSVTRLTKSLSCVIQGLDFHDTVQAVDTLQNVLLL